MPTMPNPYRHLVAGLSPDSQDPITHMWWYDAETNEAVRPLTREELIRMDEPQCERFGLIPEDLHAAEVTHKEASAAAERARLARNALVTRALSEGWTHAQIARATGLTRGRIGQIAMERNTK